MTFGLRWVLRTPLYRATAPTAPLMGHLRNRQETTNKNGGAWSVLNRSRQLTMDRGVGTRSKGGQEWDTDGSGI